VKFIYHRSGLGNGNKSCVVDNKKGIFEGYVDEKLTLQGLLPPVVAVQNLV
jgi:hypothetical protein